MFQPSEELLFRWRHIKIAVVVVIIALNIVAYFIGSSEEMLLDTPK
jgi:hypothetical protein